MFDRIIVRVYTRRHRIMKQMMTSIHNTPTSMGPCPVNCMVGEPRTTTSCKKAKGAESVRAGSLIELEPGSRSRTKTLFRQWTIVPRRPRPAARSADQNRSPSLIHRKYPTCELAPEPLDRSLWKGRIPSQRALGLYKRANGILQNGAEAEPATYHRAGRQPFLRKGGLRIAFSPGNE